jgi:hypothetical protein
MIMSNYEEMQSIWADQKQRREQANRANVPTILGALAALGIAQVEVAFDGYADEGQIDRIDATGGSGELTGEITVETAPWDGPKGGVRWRTPTTIRSPASASGAASPPTTSPSTTGSMPRK